MVTRNLQAKKTLFQCFKLKPPMKFNEIRWGPMRSQKRFFTIRTMCLDPRLAISSVSLSKKAFTFDIKPPRTQKNAYDKEHAICGLRIRGAIIFYLGDHVIKIWFVYFYYGERRRGSKMTNKVTINFLQPPSLNFAFQDSPYGLVWIWSSELSKA